MANNKQDPKRMFWNAYQRVRTNTTDRKLKLACEYLKISIGDGILRSVELWSEAVLEEIMNTKDKVHEEIENDKELDGMLGDAYKILETTGYINPNEVSIDDFKEETKLDITDTIAEEEPEHDPLQSPGTNDDGTKDII